MYLHRRLSTYNTPSPYVQIYLIKILEWQTLPTVLNQTALSITNVLILKKDNNTLKLPSWKI